MGGKSEKRVRKRKGDQVRSKPCMTSINWTMITTVLLALCVCVFAVGATCTTAPGYCIKEEYLQGLAKPLMKSIFSEVDGIKESWTSRYFRYVKGCSKKINPYESVRRSVVTLRFVKTFCMDVLGSMTRFMGFCMDVLTSMTRFVGFWMDLLGDVAADVARLCNITLYSKRVIYHNATAGSSIKDNTNPCSNGETDQSSITEHQRDHEVYFFNTKNRLHIIQKNNMLDDGYSFIQDQEQYNAKNHIAEVQVNAISPKGRDPIFVRDGADNNISEIYSEGFQLYQPEQFLMWLSWATLIVVGTLILIRQLLHSSGGRGQNIGGEYYCSPYNKNVINPKQKSTTSRPRKTSMHESTQYGRFLDYVDISISKQGSPKKELKLTPVRRSLRIRNKSAHS